MHRAKLRANTHKHTHTLSLSFRGGGWIRFLEELFAVHNSLDYHIPLNIHRENTLLQVSLNSPLNVLRLMQFQVALSGTLTTVRYKRDSFSMMMTLGVQAYARAHVRFISSEEEFASWQKSRKQKGRSQSELAPVVWWQPTVSCSSTSESSDRLLLPCQSMNSPLLHS